MSSGKLDMLLNNKNLDAIEAAICKEKGCNIYKEDIDIIENLIEKEIETSEIPIDSIAECIDNNPQIIIDFGLRLLEHESPKMLSWGIAITYTIYWILLKEDDKALGIYITKRRIPNPSRFAKRLRDIRSKIKNDK